MARVGQILASFQSSFPLVCASNHPGSKEAYHAHIQYATQRRSYSGSALKVVGGATFFIGTLVQKLRKNWGEPRNDGGVSCGYFRCGLISHDPPSESSKTVTKHVFEA